MSGNARDWVLKKIDHRWKDLVAIGFLELLIHIITDLTNAVKGGVADLGVVVFKMLDNDWDHSTDIVNIVNVLTNLRESHKTCVFVAPVCIIRNSVLHDGAHKWKTNRVTNCRNDLVNTSLSEVDVIFTVQILSILFILESLFWLHPRVLNRIIDVNHKFENGLYQIFQKLFVFLGDGWDAFNYRNKELNRKLSNLHVCEIVLDDNWTQLGKDFLKLCLEKFGLNFSDFIEFDERVF